MDTQVKANKLDALTGLRAIAALAVFAQHFMATMNCRVISGPIGGVAVSFFFVLSGFILVYVYKNRLTSASTPKFYFTRFARIWPLHIACLLITVMLLPNFLPPTDLPWLRAFSHGSLLQSWYPTSDWIGCYNGVSWSISAEAFFYFVFPWLLLGTTRQFWAKYVCLFLATIGILILMACAIDGTMPMKEVASSSLDPRKFAQFFPPFRLLEFATGMAAGILFLKRAKRGENKRTENRFSASPPISTLSPTLLATALEFLVLGLSIFCFQIFSATGVLRLLYSLPEFGPTLKHWMSFCGGMFFHAITIYVFAKSAGWVSRFMGSRTMVFLGEISFAFYMIHYPLIYFIKSKFWFGSNFSFIYFAALTLVICVAVSSWLYFLVEIPSKQTLLKWYSGDVKLKQLLVEMLVKPIQHIAKSSMLPAMVLAIVVPVVITKVYQRIDRKSFTATSVLQSVSPDFQAVNFGRQVELLAANVTPRRDAARVSTVWKFSSPGEAFVSIHFAGTEFGTRRQKISCRPEDVGRPILTSTVVYQGKIKEADRIELSLNFNGQQIALSSPSSQVSENETDRYTISSRDQIQQGLRVSRLPVLTR